MIGEYPSEWWLLGFLTAYGNMGMRNGRCGLIILKFEYTIT